VATVTHEPVGVAYRPRHFLRAKGIIHEMPEIPEVRSHISRIREFTQIKPYVETGWPCFAAVPLLAHTFSGRFRLVHIVRHPVKAALSLQTHGYYQHRDDAVTRYAQLTPFDPGVVQKEYAARWKNLTPYEKCLFQWTEINLYAEEVFQKHPDVPRLRIRAEDLFCRNSEVITQLLHFLSLPARKEIFAFARTRVDRFRMRSPFRTDWKLVFKHPSAIALAERFGYEIDGLDTKALAGRYAETLRGKTARILRGRWRSLRTLLKEKVASVNPILAGGKEANRG
jgi:hypothetical protein